AVSDTSGGANASLQLDDGDTASGASVTNWSYGFIPQAGQIPGTQGCFDNTITTPCNLLDLCDAAPDFCPLPLGCLRGRADAAGRLPGGLLANQHPGIDNYFAEHRSCGFPVSCLIGDLAHQFGVPNFPGDECPVALGCLDYSNGTQCPQDGLMTVIASTRGE